MKLIYHPNKWLEKKVKPFDFTTHDPHLVSKEMIGIMEKSNGVGLAANQVELDAQIFIIKPTGLKDHEDGKPIALINPKIEAVTEDMELGVEGCLSYPGLYLKVNRPKGLVVEYLDLDKKECKIELLGCNARIFGHEYDHLYVINFTDRVSKLRLEMAKKKQKKLFKKYKVDIKW